MSNGYGIRVQVWGDFALFARPEFRAEHVSYDIMTPSAARGILEAIHWKPAIRWVIDRVHVLRPIRFETLQRNEVGSKLPYTYAYQAASSGGGDLALYVEDDRQQRASLLLRDVAYVIDAHFEMTARAGAEDNVGKHVDIMRRRLARGQCVQQPCFGCREFPAYFEPFPATAKPEPDKTLMGERDLGFILHDIDFQNGATPHFVRAQLVDGVLELPPLSFGARL